MTTTRRRLAIGLALLGVGCAAHGRPAPAARAPGADALRVM